MLIALDYDGTYTLDNLLFDAFISFAKGSDPVHKVICVTMRHDNEEERITQDLGIDIIYTGRKAKESYLFKIGIEPDIWIDDNPLWIYENG